MARSANYQKGEFLLVPNKSIVLKLRGAALNVYLSIAAHAGDDGRCYPSYSTMAQETGYQKRQCIRAMIELEEKGLIAKAERKVPNRGNTSNVYQMKVIHIPSVPQYTGGSVLQNTPASGVDVTPKLYPYNSTNINSKDEWDFKRKRAYAIGKQQDRALLERQAGRASTSNKGSFGSVGDVMKERLEHVQARL